MDAPYDAVLNSAVVPYGSREELSLKRMVLLGIQSPPPKFPLRCLPDAIRPMPVNEPKLMGFRSYTMIQRIETVSAVRETVDF